MHLRPESVYGRLGAFPKSAGNLRTGAGWNTSGRGKLANAQISYEAYPSWCRGEPGGCQQEG
eukprot:954230-Alexandrium_andersonii.AAC.1